MRLDFHFHSDASDGTRDVAKLAEILKNLDIFAASLTDHDNMDNVDTLKRLLSELRARTVLVPGIELSTLHEGHNIHVLGYFNDDSYRNPQFLDILKSFRDRRITRAMEMTEKLKKLFGIEIDLDELDLRPGASLGRPHMAALISRKYKLPMNEVFRKYLGNDSPAYIPSSNMTYREGVDLINSFKGTAVIAHPGEYRNTEIHDLLIPGIAGIECYYPTHSKELTGALIGMAEERGLFITCGTDDHGIPEDHKHGLIGSQRSDMEKLRPFLHHMGISLQPSD